MLRATYESFCRAVIRFWDGLFLNEDMNFYRLQIEKLQNENKELTARVFDALSPKQPVQNETEEPIDWQPIGVGYESVSAKRRRLENESLTKARSLRAEAEKDLNRAKTTAQLEDETGVSLTGGR